MSSPKLAAIAAAVVSLAGGTIQTARAGDTKSAVVIASLAAAPKDDGTVAFVVSGAPAPVSAKVSPTTVMNGWCIHCQMTIKFAAADAAKGCAPCGCGMSNAACVAGSAPKNVTWQQLVQALPRGTVMKLTYTEEGKPETGVKALAFDRHSALLPLDDSAKVSASQLADAAKAAGANKSELLSDGKQALLTFSGVWTKDRQSKFEQALAQAGGKLAPVEKAPEAKP